VTFPLSNGSDFTFALDPLSHPIGPSQCTSQVLATKLSLKLAKESRGTKWTTLEAIQATPPLSATQSTTSTIAYPTSSRKGTKNWDALEREAIEDAKAWEKPDGDAAANALFRDLYANASDDVKRALIKSYVESNGTTLSTDWGAVGKKKIETKPPDSMIAKKWDE
jgi:suppressor of G2 allele of SKP1